MTYRSQIILKASTFRAVESELSNYQLIADVTTIVHCYSKHNLIAQIRWYAYFIANSKTVFYHQLHEGSKQCQAGSVAS